MNSERITELRDFSNEFLLKLQESEDSQQNNESNNNRSHAQKIKKSYSTLNSDPHIKTTFTGNIPKKRLNSNNWAAREAILGRPAKHSAYAGWLSRCPHASVRQGVRSGMGRCGAFNLVLIQRLRVIVDVEQRRQGVENWRGRSGKSRQIKFLELVDFQRRQRFVISLPFS